jgi:cell division protein FtsN
VSSQTESLFRNDDPAYEPQESSAARWFRWFVYGFVGLCAAGIAVWVLTGSPDKPVPTIKGPASPDRAAAGDDPARVPHQDQPIYERLAAGSNPDRGTELLPAAEQPMTRDQLNAAIAAQQGTGTETPATAAPAAADQTDTGTPVASLPPSGSDPAAPSPAASNAPPAVTKDANPAASAFHIQVASVANEDQAKAEWARISSRHPDLLSRLQGFYPEFTNSRGNTYTRVQGGPLVDKALAELLCSQLKARKVDCFVIEP